MNPLYQSPSLIFWVTNDPTAAEKMTAADRAYENAKAAATNLPLGAKVDALRVARRNRDAAGIYT
jgi:hypothetical protein